MKKLTTVLAAAVALSAFGAWDGYKQMKVPGYTQLRAIPYYPEEMREPTNWYQKARCTLDVRIPEGATNWPCVVWFHGGGLVHGPQAGWNGGFCQVCKPGSGIGGVSVLYRLLTNASPEQVVGDAGAAVAWTLKHIAEFGGDPKKVFLSGSSAGGYLTEMIGMDPKWLAPYGYKPADLAGLMPETGQMAIHFGVRAALGDKTSTYLTKVNEWAPLSYARAGGLPAMCIMCGEPAIDIECRAEENRLLYASLLALGNRNVEFHSFWGRRHGTMSYDAGPYELDFVRRRTFEIDGTWTATSNQVLNCLMSYVAAGRVSGVVSVLSDAAYETKFDCAGWADVEKKTPMRPDTVFAVFSMTKTFTGAALMCAVDDGLLALADPVSKYLPEFADVKMKDGSAPRRAVTVLDLMSHVSGFRGGYPLVNCDLPQREVARRLAATPLATQPGEAFSYNTATFAAAAACLEVAAKMPFEKYLFKKILDPLGMKDTTFTPNASQVARLVKAYTTDDKLPIRPAADGCSKQLLFPKEKPLQPAAGGGLFSTAQDMVRFSQMLAHHGEWHGRTIISRKTFDEIWMRKQTPSGVKQPYTVGSWLYGDWFGHEGAMRTDQRANLRTGHSRVFFIQTENKAGSAFFQLKKDWHAACDAVQGTPATEFGN